MKILDASAILAFLKDEQGAEMVLAALESGSACSAANWSEVAQKVRSAGADWGLASSLLHSFDVTIEPVTADDAERAAELWSPKAGLSLADRLCLALADRKQTDALTADRAWSLLHPRVQLIRES
ncbi:MAG TPA: type II toxin-antitoxin system VapC family toxin [Microbacteriaceae bacterium]|nr:type II toxin-antitoxin system VapC family toxin [Microbacteriaceae bacterium]